jgi:hypothetical protein
MPFTVPPLSIKVDWAANSITLEMVLEGKCSNSELEFLQSKLLEHCKKEQDTGIIGERIEINKWKDEIQAWKESTTTSHLGRYLGHYKALLSHGPDDPQSDAGKELRENQDSLIGVHIDLLNYALKHRYSFDRWKTIANVIIPKEKGNNKIHKICIIHIYEADYSALVGIMWRTLIKALEVRGTLNPGQVGGCADHDANTLIFMEEMKNEICHFSRKLLIIVDNDAAACYDRIIPNIANLVGRKKGLTQNLMSIYAQTLAEAKLKLKTALGVSDEFYQHCQAFPIYGTGQGSTNSPTIWLIISSIPFDIHDELGN